MAKPKLSWFPVSLLRAIVVEKSMTTDDWLRKAKDYGLRAVEVYYKFLGHRDLAYVESLSHSARDLGVEISMLTCSPDLTNPDSEIRRQQKSIMEMQVENAHMLGTPVVRVTAGQKHPGVSDEEGVRWVVDSVMELQGFASKPPVKIAIENHYRDPVWWEMNDFAAKADVFYKIYEELEDTPVLVNYNCATPVASGDDPLAVLDRVMKDVVNVHAADWLPTRNDYAAAGTGAAPFDEIFRRLAERGFSGHISVVDGAGGEEDTRRSIEFLQGKIDQYWPG